MVKKVCFLLIDAGSNYASFINYINIFVLPFADSICFLSVEDFAKGRNGHDGIRCRTFNGIDRFCKHQP